MKIGNAWTWGWNQKNPHLADYKKGLSTKCPFKCLQDRYKISLEQGSSSPKIPRHIFIELNKYNQEGKLKLDSKSDSTPYKATYLLDLKTGQLRYTDCPKIIVSSEYRFKCFLGFIFFPMLFFINEGVLHANRWVSLQDPETLGYTDGRILPDGRVKRAKALLIQDLNMIKSMFLYYTLMECLLFMGIFCPLTGTSKIASLERIWNNDLSRTKDVLRFNKPYKEAKKNNENPPFCLYLFFCLQPVGNINQILCPSENGKPEISRFAFKEGNKIWSSSLERSSGLETELNEAFKKARKKARKKPRKKPRKRAGKQQKISSKKRSDVNESRSNSDAEGKKAG